jgi:hypothetical protein
MACLKPKPSSKLLRRLKKIKVRYLKNEKRNAIQNSKIDGLQSPR